MQFELGFHMAERQIVWHRILYESAYRDFSVEPPIPHDHLSYLVTVICRIAYLASTFIFWIVLNFATLPFGVFVEPLWKVDARFRRLQFPGGIPVISVALPLLLAFAAYRTYLVRGIFDVVAPFLLFAVTSIGLLAGLAGFNVLRRALSGGLDSTPR
jgi:hypothetical protein